VPAAAHTPESTTVTPPEPDASSAAAAPAPARAPVPPRTKPPGPVQTRDTRLPVAAAPVATGVLQLAITPWGQVEVDGAPVGTTPPLTRMTLGVGSHTVTVRNDDLPAHTTTVQVTADKPVTVRHRF
jgi:eukaryotic-like serine/threonine-protein kinase